MTTSTPRTARTLPSVEELAAVEHGYSRAFGRLEGLQVDLGHILEEWSPEPELPARRLSEEELTSVLDALEPGAPAAGPTLADIGAIYSCLEGVRVQVGQTQASLAELDESLHLLDSMRLDLEKESPAA